MSPATVHKDLDLQNETILRRYMDLPKLIDLLRSKSLYLRRVDGFSDRFEGALLPLIRLALDHSHKSERSPVSADEFCTRGRLGSFVSCWTIGSRDNMALWQLYGGVKTSVVVTTTVDKLVRVAVSWKDDSYIHRVKYTDYVKAPDMVVGRYHDMLTLKHDSYAYEDEVRLIVPQQETWKSNPDFLRLPLKAVDDLVMEVFVAPEADESFLEAVKDVCLRYELRAPVSFSKLAHRTL